jgi:hypothetical protein
MSKSGTWSLTATNTVQSSIKRSGPDITVLSLTAGVSGPAAAC